MRFDSRKHEKSSMSGFSRCTARVLSGVLALFFAVFTSDITARAQSSSATDIAARGDGLTGRPNTSPPTSAPSGAAASAAVNSVSALYFDPLQGVTSSNLVQRALTSNAELSAARLDIERGRARLRQAGLRPNPTIDFEQTTGRLTGSPGDRSTSIGIALPLEIGGRRRRRIELAQAELEAAEAEIANRERQLRSEVLGSYADALAALRELQITEGLINLDTEMVRLVEARVGEGDAAPIELSLLRVEVDRLLSRRALAEGRLQAALIKLKNIAGIPLDEPLKLREDLAAPSLREPPDSVETAVEIALRTRPDLRLAQLNEEVAQAGLRLARAQGTPEVTISARFVTDRSITDLPEPLIPVPDRNRSLAVGVSVGLPVFNSNQGAKVEAAIAITQAQRRREFAEQVVRAEVTSAFRRYEAACSAITIFDQGVIARSNENIRTIRAAYQLGAFSITELLTQQRQLLEAQREFTEALAERYRALADLQSAIGIPSTLQP
jgi:cobalt-zinc-cadmium efflux system outer membrane protein